MMGSLLGSDLSIAQWVYDKQAPAGLGTDTLPAAIAQYLPLKGSHRALGVLAVEPTQRRRLLLARAAAPDRDVCGPDCARTGARRLAG